MASQLLTIEPLPEKDKTYPPLLAHGFRPFFLLAAAYGAFFLILWMAVFLEAIKVGSAFTPVVLHGHEMVFGFASAAMCGFLLTATATWSRMPPVRGTRLGVIAGIWAAGRLAVWLSGYLPGALVAFADLALFPALGWATLPVFISRGNRQNLVLLLVLGLFAAANALVHLEVWLGVGWAADVGLRLGVGLLVLLIVIVIGRIVPTFINVSRLGQLGFGGSVSRPWLEGGAIGSVALFVVADTLASESTWAGSLALVAAAFQILRMGMWKAGRLLRKPYIWAMHLGYAWLTAGLALVGLSYLEGSIPWVSGLHAITAGGVGTMILAVMSVVGLLHTGRPAEVRPAIIAAYLLVSAAALVRTLAPVYWHENYLGALVASGALWVLAFSLYLVVYAPILAKPRPDGIEG